jgi:hypothetical protein
VLRQLADSNGYQPITEIALRIARMCRRPPNRRVTGKID